MHDFFPISLIVGNNHHLLFIWDKLGLEIIQVCHIRSSKE